MSIGARFSPQPGSPRMQMPTRPFLWMVSAICATCFQVGFFGMVMPYLVIRSLRYIRNEDSP